MDHLVKQHGEGAVRPLPEDVRVNCDVPEPLVAVVPKAGAIIASTAAGLSLKDQANSWEGPSEESVVEEEICSLELSENITCWKAAWMPPLFYLGVGTPTRRSTGRRWSRSACQKSSHDPSADHSRYRRFAVLGDTPNSLGS